MKIALLPTLMVLGWIGLLAEVPAVAQNGPMPPAGGSSAGAAADQSGAPAAAANPAMNVQGVLDNGLWEGASVGPCCALCGGGNGCPPSWYTLQGARVIGRSHPRRIPLALRSPDEGTYKALFNPASPTPATPYNVVNNVPTTAANTAGTLLYTNTPSEVMNTKQFGLGVAAGYDVTIGHYFCRDRNNNDHFVEFSFWGLNSWSQLKTATGYQVPIYAEDEGYDAATAGLINSGEAMPEASGEFRGSLRTPYPMILTELEDATEQQKTLSLAFNNGIEYDYSYRSTINNFEINGRFSPRGAADRLVLTPDGRWQRRCQPGTYMSYLYGVRFLQLDETFAFHSVSRGQFADVWTAEVQDAVGDYSIATHNSLLGLQIGGTMSFRNCRWEWGVQSKVGPYLNFANQISTIYAATINGTHHDAFDQRLVANRCGASLIGEVGFHATYKFQPNLMGRAAYDFMWITNVALGPEQIQFAAVPTNRINANGGIFAQGVSLGLEWMW